MNKIIHDGHKICSFFLYKKDATFLQKYKIEFIEYNPTLLNFSPHKSPIRKYKIFIAYFSQAEKQNNTNDDTK